MICFVVTLVKIRPDTAPHVIKALRRNGFLAQLKQAPGYISTSILESDLTNDLYLVIDFWQSKYDYL
jgi:heme-degrading monooxygenase HmoA